MTYQSKILPMWDAGMGQNAIRKSLHLQAATVAKTINWMTSDSYQRDSAATRRATQKLAHAIARHHPERMSA